MKKPSDIVERLLRDNNQLELDSVDDAIILIATLVADRLDLLEACKQSLCILSGSDRQYLNKALERNSDPESPYYFLADVIKKNSQ